MKRRILWTLLGLSLTGCGRKAAGLTDGIIHRPTAGCPSGYHEVPKFFERNGEYSSACIDPTKPQSIDALYPGESAVMTIPVSRPSPNDKI